MFTEDQRAFLRGEKEYEGETAKQQRYQMRERIRRRVRDTFRDFSLLYEHADEREQDHVFNPRGKEDEIVTFREGVIDTLAFIYFCTTQIGDGRSFNMPFEELLELAIKNAEIRRRGGDATSAPPLVVDVDPDVRFLDPSRIDFPTITEKLAQEDVHKLSEREMTEFLWHFARGTDVFLPEELQEELREYQSGIWRYKYSDDPRETDEKPEDTEEVPYGFNVDAYMSEDGEPDVSGTVDEVDEEAQNTVIQKLAEDPNVSWEELADAADITEQLAQEVVGARKEEIADRLSGTDDNSD